MSDIQRFTLYTDGLGESKTGRWVEYEEHLAIVEKLKQEIEDAYERGFFNGSCTAYEHF